MNWKQILAAVGILCGGGVVGHYTVPQSQMDAAIAGIQVVHDSLCAAHYECSAKDSTGKCIDSVLVTERWIPISLRINNNHRFVQGDTIIYIGIEKHGDSVAVFGLKHEVTKDEVSYIAKYDEVF